MKIETGNIEVVKGIQKSMWDKYVVHFAKPGDFVRVDPKTEENDGLTSQSASQFAKRMSVLTGAVCHSYFHAVEKKFYVRRRLDNEVPIKEEEQQVEQSSDSSDSE